MWRDITLNAAVVQQTVETTWSLFILSSDIYNRLFLYGIKLKLFEINLFWFKFQRVLDLCLWHQHDKWLLLPNNTLPNPSLPFKTSALMIGYHSICVDLLHYLLVLWHKLPSLCCTVPICMLAITSHLLSHDKLNGLFDETFPKWHPNIHMNNPLQQGTMKGHALFFLMMQLLALFYSDCRPHNNKPLQWTLVSAVTTSTLNALHFKWPQYIIPLFIQVLITDSSSSSIYLCWVHLPVCKKGENLTGSTNLFQV